MFRERQPKKQILPLWCRLLSIPFTKVRKITECDKHLGLILIEKCCLFYEPALSTESPPDKII